MENFRKQKKVILVERNKKIEYVRAIAMVYSTYSICTTLVVVRLRCRNFILFYKISAVGEALIFIITKERKFFETFTIHLPLKSSKF